ncbi:LacI family DNA-binding transcriptional regulator [Palleronia sp. LCG004]|uniref:LacI family DNA-binding transcriptional regulator n=1 Tax=Palleronia sp. LCG004 TaxID=3079304 RepID=UPI002941C1E3|nr:LacI family DNA-binding transcriptional regulator [Palleronia sp. LCG004]WOI58176.1 LacI family DNA-binding transcriptional regulator [Palleronia sp. LCG004]
MRLVRDELPRASMMNDRTPHPTARISDVARLAKVSTATVSRTLSNPAIVSEKTRTAVLSAVQATGYSANVVARNLRRQRTGGVMVLAPNLANPFFSEILAGMSDVLHEEDINLILADTQVDIRSRRRLIGFADRSRADGLMILDGRLDPTLFQRPQCPPVVQVCEVVEGLHSPRVVVDNASGTAAVVDHLVELGHRRIAHLSGPDRNSLTSGRERGFSSAMARHGLAPRAEWSFRGDFTLAGGEAAAARILALSARPSAIVCDNDEMACGLMSALHRAGLSIPGDISVTGFDDIELSRHLTPALTTIRQPRRIVGRAAAARLIAILSGTLDEKDEDNEVIPVELVIRGSTGPAR